ncbi:TPA: type VI secretion system ImpA family N-terminal domain-containing protein [Klebsiella aerogenes]|uniref:VasL domain-containing protein n=1 Tax=Klebsiella aerogenes TaxID=548 RepID=UPI00229658DE|nr:VasL domain-containing protein [Klebsiella aerogenes]MDA3993443.1 type VI secretion system ImpA family N-terminal domain-containing protein [Klebsiella aerogenes]HCT4435663.1 type VI secretion system ImpA family N-terminal domain-containing protein [Klebsiella aerogenes]HDS6593296.1 type VI secretion system ImpA family N-terminal domain-containing protein [Klebsiella aerogenes]HDU6300831.1 type VI secretion system ImpA family N-terminal domain-containing protein [Klebsiella aerogenes]
MTTYSERHLTTGGDPRTQADYAKLREEMQKLSHPARPDVNWRYAEQLCLSLFDRNGVDLQTAAWYTLARTQLAGLFGLNEGLAILETLITRQWGALWPQPVHARMEIVCGLSKRLQQALRTLTLAYADLSELYQAETHLKALDAALQRLELKHAGQLDVLVALIHNAAVRLENSDGIARADNSQHAGVTVPGNAIIEVDESVERIKRVYIAPADTTAEMATGCDLPSAVQRWRPFAAGMITMLLLTVATIWGWRVLYSSDQEQVQFAASLAPLPVALSAEQLRSFQPRSPSADKGILQTQQQLARLAELNPDWAIDDGERLVQQALTLWPEQAQTLSRQWRQQLAAAALPVENLNGWHQGMKQLQQLAQRLDALDEQKGKYLTVSELKSAVFAMTQSFNRTVPVEEQLRQLAEMPQEQAQSSAQQHQAEQHLQQLITRYALLKLDMKE